MTLLEMIKTRCGIPAAVTVYDDSEIIPLIHDALDDMKSAGVPETLLVDGHCISSDSVNPRVITAIALYVQGMRGPDRTDTSKYVRLYRDKLHKLMLEPEGGD